MPLESGQVGARTSIVGVAIAGTDARRQDRVKTRQRSVKDGSTVVERVSSGGMTFASAPSLVIVIGLLVYLVAALIRPEKF
jgi:K+-transporting ATPase KdpF subunit